MPIVDPYLERKTAKVMRDTWGHLDAEPGKRYRGSILFAEGEYGDLVILRVDFGEAGNGPWFHEAINDWLIEQETESGEMYRFEGYYLLTKRGEHRFRGNVRTQTIEREATSDD
jgi:hypothetical protein